MNPDSKSSGAGEEPSSMKTTVQELAAEGKMELKQSKLPAVPIYLVIRKEEYTTREDDSSQNSMSDMSQIVTRQAVDAIVQDLQDVVDQSYRSTGPFVHYSVWYPPYQMFVQDTKSVNLAILAPKILRDYSYSYTKDFLASTINGAAYTSLTPNHISYACSIAFDNRNSLDPYLYAMKVTENTHVFLMDATTGILLSNSVPNSTFLYPNVSDPSIPVIPLRADATNDSITRDLGTFLKNKYGDYSLIPNMNGSVTIETNMRGERWFVNYRYLERPNNWIIVVGMPRSDFFGKTDSAQQKATILAVILAVAGVCCCAFLSWFTMRPIQTLIKAMEKLTKMDFSALEGNILNERSFMLELRQLQVTFAIMCKAFASGIRQNKKLVSGGASDRQRTRSHGTGASTNDAISANAVESNAGNM
ncbi:hypothetical protein HDU76_002430 [Blyttiomyces sp. JEL0837]|nr:hypothetical protein HDU76_002430 [Blyttiomyces sp. JEL0837]